MTFSRGLMLAIYLSLLLGSVRYSNKKEDPLFYEMGLSEQKIHLCLISKKMNCLKNRVPSSSVSEGMVEKLNWLFSSSAKRLKFHKLMSGLRSADSLLDNQGVGMVGEAYFGAGGSWLSELVRHNGKLGLFCAPGAGLKTDVGVSLGLTALRTLSCGSNLRYAGNFLSLSAGLSGEMIGLPVGVGLNYSFGVNLADLQKSIVLARRSGKLNPHELRDELVKLRRLKYLYRDQGVESERARNLIYFGAALLQVMEPDLKFGLLDKKLTLRFLKESISKNQSLGQSFKLFLSSRSFKEFFHENDMPELKEFFLILGRSFSGCDSVGGAGSLSLSLSPLTLGMTYTNYSLIYESPEKELRSIDHLTPLKLLNPFLLSPSELQFMLKNARKILEIPGKVKTYCNYQKL